MWIRIVTLITKELRVILRDPRSRVILIVPPLIQLLVFAFAATLEVKHVDAVVLDRDAGTSGRALVQAIQGSPTFRRVTAVRTHGELRDAIDRQRALVALEIGPTFSSDLAAGRAADVQIHLDGRRSNAAQIVDGYLTQIVNDHVASASARRPGAPPVRVVARNWFNPNLEFQWFTVPGLIGVIALLIGLIVTALSVARERELGTFDQLMVAPLRPFEILIGKMTPPILIGLVHVTLYVLAAVLVFHVPLRGSLAALYLGAVFFLAAVVGVGLFISALCTTQQQAILGAFLFMAPAVLMSGFATPIANMPSWLGRATVVNPLRHFLVIVRGVFLRGMDWSDVARNVVPLLAIAAVTLTAATVLFRRRIE